MSEFNKPFQQRNIAGYQWQEMARALEADGEKLRQLTGEDHGPWLWDEEDMPVSQLHELKCEEPHYTDVAEGRKRFEVRFNDRGFHEGDTLELVSTASGARIRVDVLHILHGAAYGCGTGAYGVAPGYVIMSIRLTGWESQHELPCL